MAAARRSAVDRTALGRLPERGHHDFATIASVIDAGLVCHVGLVSNAHPVVVPVVYGRIDRQLYIHGSVLARWLGDSCDAQICVTVTLIDALVLARSAYQHSLNFRSVVAFGRARAVEDEVEKIAALRAIVEQVCPGRWPDVREPTAEELKATLVIGLDLNEASAKIRTGPAIDFEKDLRLPVWAGLVPVASVRGIPVPDDGLAAETPLPAYLKGVSEKP